MSRKQRRKTEKEPVAEPSGASATADVGTEPTPAVESAPEARLDATERRTDRRIGWGLFIAGFLSLLLTEQPAGFVRDESVYFSAAESYARWYQLLLKAPSTALSDESIVRFFDNNHEHPVLMKTLFGWSYLIFSEGLHWVRPATGFRIPAFLVAALILPLIFAFTRRLFGRPAGIVAAASFLLVPRQFFEAHLSCFDVPMATAWLLVAYCFWQAMERPRWWLYTGLAFGAAMGTKHNAYFIPFVLIPFGLWRGWLTSAGNARARELFLAINGVFVFGALLFGVTVLAKGPAGFQSSFMPLSAQTFLFLGMVGAGSVLLWRLRAVDADTFRAMAPLVAMAGLGPVLFLLHWPYLWYHPVDRLAWYLAFHAQHNHYTWYYLGRLLRGPPFPLEYVVVKTALTVPTSLFVPMALGFGWVVVRIKKATWLEVLIAVNAVASIAIISYPTVPHFGGVKHWFPSMPFLAVLMGGSLARGAQGLTDWLKPRLPKVTQLQVFTALSALVCIPAVIATVRVYPYGTSAYSELAGGLPGAATLGMQRQFWANNVTGVLPWINANAQPGERVYLHENHGGQIHDYQRNGMLRTDLGFVGSPGEADLVAYQYHQEFREHEFNAWEALGTQKPVYGLYVDETPQIIVYRRRK